MGGGSPKNFYLQGQPTLWEVYGIPKGGNDYFIQFTTDQVVWGGLSGATPSEAVSWGKVNPSVLPDTVVAYSDSTIAFPLFCEYAVGSKYGRRKRKALYHQREALVADCGRRAGPRCQRAKSRALIPGRGGHRGTLAQALQPIAAEPRACAHLRGRESAGRRRLRHAPRAGMGRALRPRARRSAARARHRHFRLARELGRRSSPSTTTSRTTNAFHPPKVPA
jgi:hypothetical protein